MSEISEANFYIYRDGRRRVAARKLIGELLDALAKLSHTSSRDEIVSALLRAGELECGLCDADLPQSDVAAAITDELALRACEVAAVCEPAKVSQQAAGILAQVGNTDLTISRPEGFAYYALHPLDFAELVGRAECRFDAALAIGIRSIGTTLSAVVRAGLKASGVAAERITVRPVGHPYARRTDFDALQRGAVRKALESNADFLVCDEGPGRSGSSLLSVAEALEREGVDGQRITILCSHQPHVDGLCATDGPSRWRRYRSMAAGMSRHFPSQAGEYIGAGEWRRALIPDGQDWPAAWPQMERLKYLSRDCRSVWKFQGHGHYGASVAWRDELLATSGFGVPYLGRESGFGAHKLVQETWASAGRVTPEMLRRIAEYSAWRAKAFSITGEDETCKLREITRSNLEQEFGSSPELNLAVVRSTVCDARMHPSKWRRVEGRWLKLDGSTHGDDHFFPGPTDIAWDLAGTCVEWQLTPSEREYFLGQYVQISSDNIKDRIGDYQLAYAAFRMAWSKMAAVSTRGSEDELRLAHDYLRYRHQVEELIAVRQRGCSSLAA